MMKAINPIDVVLFDLGGVLVELAGVPTMLEWLNHRFTVDELWVQWLSSDVVRAFERGQIDPDAFADGLIASMQLSVDRATFLRVFDAWPRGLLPQALEVVRRVSPRCVRATLSNTNVLHWSRVVDGMGLRRAFDHHFASHEIGKLKPDRDVFEHVVTRLNCRPSAVLFFDDNQTNVDAAQRFGMHAVRVQGPIEALRVLSDHGLIAPLSR